MKLLFLCHPVENIKESTAFYRDTLGFKEAWREGDHTVTFQLPDSEVRLMIEDDENDLLPGGVFLVGNVDDFYNRNKEKLDFIKSPIDIPPGRYAIYKDISGNPIRILDFTNED
ncbi:MULTISPECIES: VOC family protein [Oceanobacillus]|uniref:VOC family protein n=1 Tax=Oceanobacillus TaxID=182709 RepID=UPI00201DE4BE|nr:VOC family protein [Oceanobacillus saliphilus]